MRKMGKKQPNKSENEDNCTRRGTSMEKGVVKEDSERVLGGPWQVISFLLLLNQSFSHTHTYTHTVPRSCTRAFKFCLILSLQTLLGLGDSSKSVSH